ncbi:6-phosphogluconolactonase [Luteococcus sp. Sow4_B9]|uniref:6-phosphogluconolactonase n=1 Tax=Luteococcus sp. Sow4_B9 TaxID=3438792 RepID=UPI003F95DAB9
MSQPRVLRHEDTDDLVAQAASHLLHTLLQLQETQETVHLCLTGGRTANRIYERFAELVPDSGLRPEALHLWWSDDCFVSTTDPDRNALQALSILARTLHLSSAQTHPMPASDGKADPGEAAYAYAHDLGETTFDVCLLGLGADGHVASIFPGHPSHEQGSSLAIGVTDSPKPPAERISLTLRAINRSQRVWVLVTGQDKAAAVARALQGDQLLPATQVRGELETLWFVDESAAEDLPFYRCGL